MKRVKHGVILAPTESWEKICIQNLLAPWNDWNRIAGIPE